MLVSYRLHGVRPGYKRSGLCCNRGRQLRSMGRRDSGSRDSVSKSRRWRQKVEDGEMVAKPRQLGLTAALAP